MRLCLLCCVLCALLAGCTGGGSSPVSYKPAENNSAAGRPAWVEDGETGTYRKTMFWLAVGSGDTPEQAAQAARQEVAAQIKTHVRSRITDMASSDGETVQERFEAISQNLTDTKLEGLETLEQFTGRRRSYALAGLNKSVYLGKIESRVKDLYTSAASSYSQAMTKKAEGLFWAYYSLLADANAQLEEMKSPEYFYRSFRQGGTVSGKAGLELMLQTNEELVNFLSAIKVQTIPAEQDGIAGQGLLNPLKAIFSAFDKPLSGFPVVFTAVRGRAVLEADSRTAADGSAQARVTLIEKSPVKITRIACRLHLGDLAPKGEYALAAAEFFVNLDTASRWVVFIDESGAQGIVMGRVTGSMKDGGVDVNQLNLSGAYDENALLAQVGKKLKAFHMVTGQFKARKVDTAMGTVTCRADGYVKGIEIATGKILFHKTIENVIGISYTGNVDEGCREALGKAGAQAAEIVRTELGF